MEHLHSHYMKALKYRETSSSYLNVLAFTYNVPEILYLKQNKPVVSYTVPTWTVKLSVILENYFPKASTWLVLYES